MTLARTRARLFLASLLALGLLNPASGISTEAPLTETVRLGTPAKSFDMLPYWLGRERGFYREEGIDLEIIVARTTAVRAAVASGDLHYVTFPASSLVLSSKGIPMKLVLGVANAQWALVTQPEIRNLGDLKGKRIGLNDITGSMQYVTSLVLKRAALTGERAATLLALGGIQGRYAALKAKVVDATWLSPPYDVQARREGLPTLIKMTDFLEFPTNALFVRDAKLRQDRKQVRGMVHATLRAMRLIRENRRAAVEALQREFGVSSETADESYETLRAALFADGRVSLKAIQTLVDMNRELPRWSETAMAGVTEFSLLEEVEKELTPRKR